MGSRSSAKDRIAPLMSRGGSIQSSFALGRTSEVAALLNGEALMDAMAAREVDGLLHKCALRAAASAAEGQQAEEELEPAGLPSEAFGKQFDGVNREPRSSMCR